MSNFEKGYFYLPFEFKTWINLPQSLQMVQKETEI